MATLTDLGVMQQSAVPLLHGFAQAPGGNMHSYWVYYYATWYGIKNNIFSIDHDVDVIYGAVEGSIGRPTTVFQHTVDNLLYIGTFGNADIAGWLGSYNFATGQYTELMSVPAWAGSPAQDGINVGMESDEVNRRIFCISVAKAGLFAYDPITGLSESFGVLDDPGGVYNRYGTSIQISSTFAYCAVKDVTNSLYYLVKVDLSDQSQTNIWKADGASLVAVYRGYDEAIYLKKTVGAVTTWYAVGDTVNAIAEPADKYGLNSRRLINYTGYSYDHTTAYPDGVGGKEITFDYHRGDTVWRQLSADLISLDNYQVNRAGVSLNGRVICYAQSYGPLSYYDPSDGSKGRVGVISNLSGYSVGLDRHRREEYYCGYARGNDWRYNPLQPWSYLVNPEQLTLATGGVTDARYTYMVHQGTDKNMWFAFSWVRNLGTRESDIGWYNPGTETTDLISAIVPVGVGVNLNTYNLDSFAKDRTGWRMVFSGYTATDSLLAVVPCWKKGVSKYLRPIAGGASQGHIVNVGTNKATSNQFVGVTVGASYKVYCIDINTGDLVWGPLTKTGTSSFLAGVNPVFGLGYVWFYVGGNIVKLDPATGDVTVVQAVTAVGGLVFNYHDSCLYHHDSTTKKLWKVSGL